MLKNLSSTKGAVLIEIQLFFVVIHESEHALVNIECVYYA